ncbi:MAG: hypothetical protein ACLPHI_17760 [Terriglobales bacterium]|jgi:hypothetical protein
MARGAATLFLGEPYSYDGALAGTGHAAVYLSGVCAEGPVKLRLCAPGESGIVISRYHRVAGYDWIAIPLVPYLYAVEKQEDTPLFADKKVVTFLRDRYRRNHLESLIPDLPDGGTPEGDWYELVGASYLRTFYAFEIETTPKQDAALIRKLNSGPNHDRFDLVTANCADFARGIINFYHPHAVHRSILADLGVTTPKQMARTLSSYSHHHPELESANFIIPQVPGTLPRSKPVHGVLECAVTAKKYMVPLFALHPIVAASLIAGYWGHWRFDPARNAMVLDATDRLDTPLSRDDRRRFQSRLQELVQVESIQTKSSAEPASALEDGRLFTALQAEAEPAIDASGHPAVQLRVNHEVKSVGITRSNILSIPDGYAFAAALVQARLREELKSTAARKTARGDIESDLVLLQQLLGQQPRGPVNASASNAKISWVTQRPPTDSTQSRPALVP